MSTKTSLEAYEALNKIHKNMWYQHIIGLLYNRSMTREQLSSIFVQEEKERNPNKDIVKITRRIDNTLRPRVYELMNEGIVTVCGIHRQDNGRNAELLTLSTLTK